MNTVSCETCGKETTFTGTKRCNGCWELESRLESYLREGGGNALRFVTKTLEDWKAHLLNKKGTR